MNALYVDAGRVRIAYLEDRQIIRVIRLADGEMLKEIEFPNFSFSGFTEQVALYNEICNHK
jgi:hypothetical protein